MFWASRQQMTHRVVGSKKRAARPTPIIIICYVLVKFFSALSSSWFRRASEEVNPFQVRYRLTGPTARPQTCGHQQFVKAREHPHGNSRSLPLAKLRREFSRKRIARWVGKARGKVNQLKESGHSRERRSRAHDCNGPKQRAPGEST